MSDDATFEKISQNDQKIHGPRKLLLCGFASEAQPKFIKLLGILNISDLPLVWVTENQAGSRLDELLELADGAGWGKTSSLPRAVIMSGITTNELHTIMSGCRQAGMKQALWATLTPTSESWPLEQLLAELAAEREAMKKNGRT
jgi:hypothetical protein